MTSSASPKWSFDDDRRGPARLATSTGLNLVYELAP
jgi:hypothetical protein